MVDIGVYLAASPKLAALIASEETYVAESLALGATYVVLRRPDRSPKVHRVTCGTVRYQYNRRSEWTRRIAYIHPDDLDQVLGGSRGPTPPRLPEFGDRAMVEALPAYRTCGFCKPELDYPDGKRVESPPRPVRARALRDIHLGRRLLHPDGSEQGHITRVTIDYDLADGCVVTVTTTSRVVQFDPYMYVDVRPDARSRLLGLASQVW